MYEKITCKIIPGKESLECCKSLDMIYSSPLRLQRNKGTATGHATIELSNNTLHGQNKQKKNHPVFKES